MSKEATISAAIYGFSLSNIEQVIKTCHENNVEITGSTFKKDAIMGKQIIDVCQKYGIKTFGNVFLRTAAEIEDLVSVCQKYGIEITGSVFNRTADEIKSLIGVCKENNIEPKGNVFNRTVDEVKAIIEICRENNIDPKGTVFMRTAGEVKAIIEICRENNIEITGSVFNKTADKLQNSVDFIKEHYDSSYLTPLVIIRDAKHLSKVFPYLEELGVLEVVRESASILSLKLDEIKERKAFIDSIGKPMVLETGRFNSIFSMTRKNYAKRVSSVLKNSDGSSYGGR